MTIQIKENFSFQAIAEDMQQETAREMYGAIADARKEMRDRTKGGEDINGRPFKKYSKSYAEYKKEYRKGRSIDPVDLELTGDMWRGIVADSRIEGENAVGEIKTITVDAAEKIIDNEKRGRKFFGLTDAQVEEIRRRVIQVINKQ